jgi:hypothetical protein
VLVIAYTSLLLSLAMGPVVPAILSAASAKRV